MQTKGKEVSGPKGSSLANEAGSALPKPGTVMWEAGSVHLAVGGSSVLFLKQSLCACPRTHYIDQAGIYYPGTHRALSGSSSEYGD